MRMTWMCVLPVLMLGAMGCQSKLADENRDLRNQNIELQEALRKRDSDLAARPDAADFAAMQAQLAQRDQQINDLNARLNAPPPAEAPKDETASFGGISVTRDDKGNITVAVPGDVLFASGDASVKSTAKTTLDRIVAIIKKDFPGKKVIVDGHSDSDPIVATKDKWKDNLDLSAARARSVADYLTSAGGLPKKQVSLRAFSDTAPKSTPAKSRRVEIVVMK
jgi:flagellar motor protein MotB